VRLKLFVGNKIGFWVDSPDHKRSLIIMGILLFSVEAISVMILIFMGIST